MSEDLDVVEEVLCCCAEYGWHLSDKLFDRLVEEVRLILEEEEYVSSNSVRDAVLEVFEAAREARALRLEGDE